MKKHVFMIVKSVNVNRGGVTKAVFKRSNLFLDAGHDVTILTLAYQSRHQEIVKRIYESGELKKGVKIKNFFEVMRSKDRFLFYKKQELATKGLVKVKVEEHPEKSYRFYKNGKYSEYRRYNSNNKLIFRDYHGSDPDDGVLRKYREEYSLDGDLIRRVYFNVANKPIFHEYYNRKKEIIYSAHFAVNSETPHSVVEYKKGKINKYKSWDDLIYLWIEQEVYKKKNVVLISEQRNSEIYLYNKYLSSAKKIVMVHANHLESPFNDALIPSPSYKRLASNIDRIDAIVVLTEEQKRDYLNFVKQPQKVKVISHAYDNHPEVKEKTDIQKNYKQLVMVARYVEDKRIEHGIKAFKEVVSHIPDAQLLIYGSGPKQRELERLIEELSLENNVYLKGFTKNVKEVYRMSGLMLMLSRREGFGMVITESMSVGTPVISYNFKYGPSDIINHGKNGYIVESGNIKELSKAIIHLLNNEDKIKRMSKEALKVKENYSEQKFQQKWLEIIE